MSARKTLRVEGSGRGHEPVAKGGTHKMTEMVVRFLVGGFIVTGFALLAEMLRPKSLAGVLSAAPSVALATLPLTIHTDGASFAVQMARSMIFGAVGMAAYAWMVYRTSTKTRANAMVTTLAWLPVWFVVAGGLYWAVLGHAH